MSWGNAFADHPRVKAALAEQAQPPAEQAQPEPTRADALSPLPPTPAPAQPPGGLVLARAEPDPQAVRKDTRNKTEKRYETQVLRPAMERGLIVWYDFEACGWRAGDGQFYYPDYVVLRSDGLLEYHEVKGGYIREDSLVKFRAICALYPHFRWKLLQYKKASGWTLLHDSHRS